MKKLFPLLFILILFGHLGFAKNVNAQDACSVQSISFDEVTGVTNDSLFFQNYSNLTINTSGNCEDGISLKLKKINDNNQHLDARIDNLPPKLNPNENGRVLAKFQVNEDTCYGNNDENDGVGNWGFECVSYIEITYQNQPIYTKDNIQNLNPTYTRTNPNALENMRNQGVLLGNCNDLLAYPGSLAPFGCSSGDINADDNANWQYEGTFNNSGELEDENEIDSNCNLTDSHVKFTGLGNRIITNGAPVLIINTTDCQGETLKVTLWEEDPFTPPTDDGDNRIDIEIPSQNDNSVEYIEFIPNDTEVKILFESGNEECDGVNTDGLDCEIYVEIEYANGDYSSENNLDDFNDDYPNTPVQDYLDKAIILAECEDTDLSDTIISVGGVVGGVVRTDCTYNKSDWTLKSITGVEDNAFDPQLFNPDKPKYDRESPCWVLDTDPDKNGNQEGYDPFCYEFLAPIPGIGQEQIVDGNPTGRFYIENLRGYSLGTYINTFFEIAVAILAVLSVIMIVAAGVQYMTVESIYGKSDAKARIIAAVTGLILALGIYTILRTINPKLLNINFGEGIKEAQVVIVDDPAELDGDGSSTTVSNAPATQICNNRKDRGYWKGQSQLKLTKIAETASSLPLGSLEGQNILITTGTPQGTNVSKKAEEGFANRVKTMMQTLHSQGITTRITEAFGPAFLGHGSPCHYLGSCIDLATGTSAANATYSVDDVEKIIRAADAAGLTAQFEFSQSQTTDAYESMQTELASRGIDACMIKYVRHATNWHFSVYDKITPSLTL
ncbi:MAG: pilin [Candidatus Pacebacteria bacterium]|nr:pilin [Candidatus Paceibacterota bacterium]